MFVKSHKNPKKNLEDWGIFRIFVFRKEETRYENKYIIQIRTAYMTFLIVSPDSLRRERAKSNP